VWRSPRIFSGFSLLNILVPFRRLAAAFVGDGVLDVPCLILDIPFLILDIPFLILDIPYAEMCDDTCLAR
jgi:hypothetical protein